MQTRRLWSGIAVVLAATLFADEVAAQGGRGAATPRDPMQEGLPLRPTRTATFTTKVGHWMSVDVSPDGQRLVFDLLGDLYTMPSSGGKAVPLTRGMAFDGQPRFSPDGNLLYFTSNRDGFVCLWAQRLDPAKKPIGPAFAIHHLHSARLSMLNMSLPDLDISVAHDKIVFNLGELTGNIWMTELGENQ